MAEQSVLITGSGLGIGRATAFAFARAGYTVIVTDILEAEGKEVAARIVQQGGAAAFHRLDVTSTEITNTSAALLIEQRRQLEALARASGLPTREEVDALHGQLRELRRELAGLASYRSPEATPPPPATRSRRMPAPRAAHD